MGIGVNQVSASSGMTGAMLLATPLKERDDDQLQSTVYLAPTLTDGLG